MEMIQKAKEIEQKEQKEYQYYLLCSGQDYLIKPMSLVESELSTSYPKPFIDCTPYATDNWVYKKFRTTVALEAFAAWFRATFKKGLLQNGFRLIRYMLARLFAICHMTTYDKMIKKGWKLYGGSAWWILPDKVIDFIYEEYFHKKSKELDILLDGSITPEETFFQIMTMRSPVCDLVDVNPTTMVAQNCKTWAYFSDVDKPFKCHPYIFTTKEFEKLQKSSCWFARKFDSHVDSDILDMIDNIILKI